MTLYWKTIGGILISIVLWISLNKQEKDLSLLLSMGICILGGMVFLSLLEPVVLLLEELENLARFRNGILESVLKVLGVALTGEITAMLCCDGGNAAMARVVGLLTSAGMLILSLPMIRSLLTLIQEILMLI